MSLNENYKIHGLSLGSHDFSNIRNKDKIYVDKTDLIYRIAIHDIPVFISRPRRFGKTLLLNTLYNLFSNGIEYFRGLAIESLWHDKTYHVARIDFSGFSSKNGKAFESALNRRIISEFCVEDRDLYFTISDRYLEPSELLYTILKKLPDDNIVLLIDEYDAPLIHHLDKLDQIDEILEILSDFYSIIKEYSVKFRFIFITGLTRASHMSIFSAFNNLLDLTLMQDYNNLLGFTRNELVQFFDPYIENASNVLNISKEEVYDRIKSYYNGFSFSPFSKETIYNPWSILHFLHNPVEGFQNYWFKTAGVSTLISKYLKANNSFDYINDKYRNVTVGNLELSSHHDIKNIPTKILLYQTGYLTLRAKDDRKGLLLVPPNHEIEESALRFYLMANNVEPDQKMVDKMGEIVNDIDSRNLPAIVELFNDILAYTVTSNSNIFYDERSVRDIIFAALTLVDSLTKFKEQQTSTGVSDLELITKTTHMIIEFKRTYPKDLENPNKYHRNAKTSLKEAIQQIKTHRYGKRPFQSQSRYYVAMVISTEEKCILPEYCQEVLY